MEHGESTRLHQRTGKVVSIDIGTRLDEAERQIIYATLDQCGWNKRAAATVLGISLKTLYNRLGEYQEAERSASSMLA
jgi:two-component system, NtrC family, response regulator AtoC